MKLLRLSKSTKKLVRRYTRFSILVDMLVNKRITLVDPSLWEDKDDTFLIEKHKKVKGLDFIGAACLTEASETFHHWKLFADGIDGICIEFDYHELERYILPHQAVRMKRVKYLTIDAIKDEKRYPIEDLPFFKRWGFSAEQEIRIIYESREGSGFYHIPIDPSCIRRIVTNPFLPEPLLDSLVKGLQSIDLCSSLKVNKSRLIDGKTWSKKWGVRIRPYES